MKNVCFLIPEDTPALGFAAQRLRAQGCFVTDSVTDRVTHALLPIPTKYIPALPEGITLIGGNLPGDGIDLLQDPFYLAKNAAITAHCGLEILLRVMPKTLNEASVLIFGWGRIGQCLAQLLDNLGARVTVAARKARDQAMAAALGYGVCNIPAVNTADFDIIVNTIPAPVMAADDAKAGAILLDLASLRGISGEGVLWERGLPGRLKPESAGALMAEAALRLVTGKE